MKRIMSFDGGGVRGVFSLEVAKRVERLFREEYNQGDLVLADVIDLFAGTSTGAIIATFLAWGYPVVEVEDLYRSHAKSMFAKQWFWRRFNSKYQDRQIARFFLEHFLEEDGKTPALLGSPKLKKLLLVVMANASTGSPWPVTNNPNAVFNARDRRDCNLDIPIWKLLRASTAAPTFFQPEKIKLGSKEFLFVDGGVSPYCNPSLIAVLMATLPCYRIGWEAGRDKIHLISIGTGGERKHFTKVLPTKINLLNSLDYMLHGLMSVGCVNQDMLCRVLGHCLHGSPLDAEIGCLDTPSLLSPAEQKFSYVRYNVEMDTSEVGTPLTEIELEMDNLESIPRLAEIGARYAEQYVRREALFTTLAL